MTTEEMIERIEQLVREVGLSKADEKYLRRMIQGDRYRCICALVCLEDAPGQKRDHAELVRFARSHGVKATRGAKASTIRRNLQQKGIDAAAFGRVYGDGLRCIDTFIRSHRWVEKNFRKGCPVED